MTTAYLTDRIRPANQRYIYVSSVDEAVLGRMRSLGIFRPYFLLAEISGGIIASTEEVRQSLDNLIGQGKVFLEQVTYRDGWRNWFKPRKRELLNSVPRLPDDPFLFGASHGYKASYQFSLAPQQRSVEK